MKIDTRLELGSTWHTRDGLECRLMGVFINDADEVFVNLAYPNVPKGYRPKLPPSQMFDFNFLSNFTRSTAEEVYTEETGWVIESLDSPPGLPIYFTGYSTRALRWSNPGDHMNACRFARKIDAKRVAGWISYWGPKPAVRVCEHSWTSPTPTSEDLKEVKP